MVGPEGPESIWVSGAEGKGELAIENAKAPPLLVELNRGGRRRGQDRQKGDRCKGREQCSSRPHSPCPTWPDCSCLSSGPSIGHLVTGRKREVAGTPWSHDSLTRLGQQRIGLWVVMLVASNDTFKPHTCFWVSQHPSVALIVLGSRDALNPTESRHRIGGGKRRSVGCAWLGVEERRPSASRPPSSRMASVSCSSPAPGSRSPGWSSSPASSSSSCSPIAPTSPIRRSPIARSTRAGRTVYTGDDIRAGQKVFLHHGLMEYGSIFGHGAYLGPDFTADYLHRSSAVGPRSAGRRRAPTPRARRRSTSSRPTATTPTRRRSRSRPSRRARSSELEPPLRERSSTARRRGTACGRGRSTTRSRSGS